MAQNHFENVVQKVESAPQNQRTDTLITAIAQQMQQAQNQDLTPSQLGSELAQIKPQLVRACQAQQGG